MFSLSEDIRDKLDQMRQARRDNYERYLKSLVLEQRAKTEKAQEIYSNYEEAIREYQRLIESRHEVALSSICKAPQNRTSVRPTNKDIQTSMLENSLDVTINDDEDDTPLKYSESNLSLEINVSEALDISVESIASKITAARELCNELKKNYSVIDSALNSSHRRIAAARDEYYRSLLDFNKLENKLVQISSQFEAKVKLELDNNIHALKYKQSKDDNIFKCNENLAEVEASPSSSDAFSDISSNANRKRKAYPEDISTPNSSHSQFKRPAAQGIFNTDQIRARRSFSAQVMATSAAVIAPLVMCIAPIVSKIFQ